MYTHTASPQLGRYLFNASQILVFICIKKDCEFEISWRLIHWLSNGVFTLSLLPSWWAESRNVVVVGLAVLHLGLLRTQQLY